MTARHQKFLMVIPNPLRVLMKVTKLPRVLTMTADGSHDSLDAGHRGRLRVLMKVTKLLRDLTMNPKRVITLDMTILRSLGKPAGAKGPGTHY